MTIHNTEIAAKFNQLADLLEIQGANSFRVRAYRNAARIISGLAKNVSDLVDQGYDLEELPGIGKDLADKIKIINKTGELPLLKQTKAKIPAILSELMKIEGLGPKRVQILYKKFHINSINDLKTVLDQGKIRKLSGFGEKTESRIRQGLEHQKQYNKRFKLAEVQPIVENLLAYLKKNTAVKNLDCAGSYRRHKETVGDLDILVTSTDSITVMKHFLAYEDITKILSQGDTRSTVHLHSGIQVDIRVVPPKSYGAALLYFTGSKEHNIRLRAIAVKKQLKLNEYGLFKGQKDLGSHTETQLYRQLGLTYIEPELREDRGEIEAAKNGILPKLIQLKDLRGDLHCHTNATDGADSLEAMAKTAAQLGYEYLAITDHSQRLTIAKGLDKKQILQQFKAIDRLNAKLKGITILKSSEIDILENGSLDWPDEILKELDLRICSVHSKFNLTSVKQTERIIRAMDNPYFNILGHATGRLINKRSAYEIDMDKILQAAKERGCIIEINAQPERLDINDLFCKKAKDLGLKFALSTDAHSCTQLHNMCFGIYQAQRGWLEKEDVVNTLPLNQLKKLLK